MNTRAGGEVCGVSELGIGASLMRLKAGCAPGLSSIFQRSPPENAVTSEQTLFSARVPLIYQSLTELTQLGDDQFSKIRLLN
jgi:hypothetical protein